MTKEGNTNYPRRPSNLLTGTDIARGVSYQHLANLGEGTATGEKREKQESGRAQRL